MIAAVKQMEAGRKAEDVAREVGVSTHTIYAWKSKYGGMDVSEAQEAKRLRDENCPIAQAGGRSEPGQGSTAVGDRKKRMELAAMKASVEHIRDEVCLHRTPGLPLVAGSGFELSLPAAAERQQLA